MPENNHEVIIDGYVYPDTVTITLANDDFVGSRDYVSKDLYESVSGANDYWQAENAKLREERDHWHVEQVHAYGNWEDVHKRAIELEKQNAKLRELVQYICDENYGDDWFAEEAAALGIKAHY